MNNTSSLSRREWLSRSAAPALAATFAYPMLVSATPRAEAPVDPAKPQTLEAKLAIFDIRDFGAVGDGNKLNTSEIQAAIDAANAAGGGIVLVPSGGTFICGTIEIKSNVNFHLATNARLLGSPKPEDYRR